MKTRLVLVEWVDSYHAPMDWSELDDDSKILLCRSVGWLARENKDCLTVVPHWTDFEHGCGEMTIPRVAVKRIQELAVTKRKPKRR